MPLPYSNVYVPPYWKKKFSFSSFAYRKKKKKKGNRSDGIYVKENKTEEKNRKNKK